MDKQHPSSFTESYWLRDAKADLLRRDPVDAIKDAEELADFEKKRLAHLLGIEVGARRAAP